MGCSGLWAVLVLTVNKLQRNQVLEQEEVKYQIPQYPQNRFLELQDHRIIGLFRLEKILKIFKSIHLPDFTSPPLNHVSELMVTYLQGWWLHRHPGQSVLVTNYPFHEWILPHSNGNLLWSNLRPLPHVLPLVTWEKCRHPPCYSIFSSQSPFKFTFQFSFPEKSYIKHLRI